MAEIAWVDPAACARELDKRGKHRTEVTEVAEGGLGFVAEIAWADPAACVRELDKRAKHRTEVTILSIKTCIWVPAWYRRYADTPYAQTPIRSPYALPM
jgi:hypothetical protein